MEEYGQNKTCAGWYVEINNGEYKLLPYGLRPKTEEERKTKANQEDQKENVVSKAASQVGGIVKQMVDAGGSVIKQDKST